MTTSQTMIPVEEALQLVLDHAELLETETVPLIDAVGRVAAIDMRSDVDISPFDHSAMDGFAMHSEDLTEASENHPVKLAVIAEVPAGSTYDGPIATGECVRIMTGAPLPAAADTVVKFEIVDYLGSDGRLGSTVAFTAPSKPGANIRRAGEEIGAGQVAIHQGEIISAAGVGFLASCGISEVVTYRKPHVAVLSIGSELVEPNQLPQPGQIRDGNAYTLCALVKQAGGVPHMLPKIPDDPEALAETVREATKKYDYVVTSGGASNGDYDFIKPVVEANGELLMTLVNMRPGKCQTFGIVNSTPVLGLPGNPAAAYCGFEVLVRQALRKMQGFSTFVRPTVKARMAGFQKKKDPRRIYLRANLEYRDGELWTVPAKNQSSGLFSTLQRGNCLAIMPEGAVPVENGQIVDCVLTGVEEGTVL